MACLSNICPEKARRRFLGESSESVRFSGYADVLFQTEVLQVVGEGVGRVAGAGDFRWGKRIDALSQQKLPHFGKRTGKGSRTRSRLFRKGVRRDGKPVLTKSLGHRFFRCPKLLMLENERGKSYATTSLYMAEFCASAISHAVNSTSFKDLSYPQFRSA